ncbi:hypothetical protein AMR41_27795 [Hapalosiphon sp. MRB220]|nr:hypothetical protein AMR41_27795 [Hapalosiphon sp. MRB220]
MPLDFSGQNLRGRSFKGQNLEGADFSGADIRGADFTNAILIGANFSHVKAGLQKLWAAVLLGIAFLLSGVSGYFSSLIGAFVNQIFLGILESQIVGCVGWVVLVTLIILLILIIRQGFNSTVAVALPFAVVFAFAVAFAFAGSFTRAVTFAGSVAFAIVIAFAFPFAFAFVGAVTRAVALPFAFAIAIAFAFPFVGVLAGFGVFFAGAVSLFSAYIAWLTLQGDEKYALIRSSAIAFAAFRGTSFYNANLTDANFTGATFKSTDLRKANLTRTRFHKAKKLDRVRPGSTYLELHELLPVLVTGTGADKNFDRKDLRGVNLQGANLTDASFIGTNLSEANLQDTDLSRAKLALTQLDSTDFTGATLTGAYIEDWGITSNTKFDGVRCEYVYTHLPTKENPDPMRKPDNRQEVFADGDFGDFIQPIFDTLDLYHNQGVDPRAIAIAFKQLAENNPNAELEIVAMEKRGQDKFLLRAKTAETANKSELSAEYFDTYNEIKALTAREIKLLVAEKENQIRRLENMVMTALERPSFYSENRTITMGDGNYNEDIQGDYIKGDYSEYG